MRLKSLSVQGYKSFAARTDFLFSPGITAVIGPNGSGKSNVADAIRWVLGEQSLQTLRGKSTTDMIFAGGRRRAQSGAAEVLLTLDNADGWLPIDFSEVTIGRRAHRSGENEYLINGSRVRLRDVTELLAESGLSQRAYAVIGQGLVDAALSLRPQERRTLFEEAAGISFYRSRREESVRRLDETHHNLERVRDIVNEITPRLVRLEAEARRVEEQQRLVAHLRRLQRTWYGFEWGQQQAALGHAQRRAAALEADLQRRRAQVASVAERVERLREQEAKLRVQLRDWHRQRADLHEQADVVQRELAVARERLRLEQSRRGELAAELEPLRAQRATQEQRAKQLRVEVGELQKAVEARARELEEQEAHWRVLQENAQQPARWRARAEERLRAHRAELARLDQALRRVQAEAARLASERAVAEERVRHLRERYQQVQGEIEPVTAQVEMQAERALLAKRRVDEQKAALRERRSLLAVAEREAKPAPEDAALAEAALAERDQLAKDLRAARAHLAEVEQAMAEQRVVAAGFSGELAAINRTLGQGTAYGAGVRALLEADLAGCLGPLGSLMHVPPELEKALEAALSDTLRSVVVDNVALAREVREVLAAAGGRATILPLDALRLPSVAQGETGRWPDGARRLADLVVCDNAVRPAVEAALGLAALCHDLDEAHALLPELPPGSVCITADGALLASSGAITLGPAETAEVLAGERERRELPMRLSDARQACEALEAQQREAQEQVHVLEVAARNADLQVQQARERAERARLEALSQMRTEIAVIEGAARGDEASLTRESALLDQLRAQMRELVRQAERVQKEQDALSQQIEVWQAESTSEAIAAMAPQAADGEVRASETAARAVDHALDNQLQAGSTLESRREAEAGRIAELEAQLVELGQQASAAAEEAARFERETVGAARTELAVARETLRSQQAGLQRELALLERLQAQVTAREQRVAELDQEQATLSQRIVDLSKDADRLGQGLERSRGQIEPAEEELTRVGRDLRALEEQGQQLRARARDAESRHDHARLEVSRQEDQVRLLTRRIEEDLGLVELEVTESVTVQAALPLRPMVSELPVVEELPDGLDDEIQRLKAGLRRLRGVNPQAPEEYREVRERHQFLSEQSDDLEEAAGRLQQAVTELDQLMESAFLQTFQAVAGEFERLFPLLFNGGSAQLVLAEPGDLMNTGVDIMAQPPGKRTQRLDLLSGGERALTAAALLFALLRVSPTPFCVLDEVDAMLDESNVGRFRALLEDLAERTQFIVITHNRVTVEAADTIYGVSMGSDGVSQMVSMKLG